MSSSKARLRLLLPLAFISMRRIFSFSSHLPPKTYQVGCQISFYYQWMTKTYIRYPEKVKIHCVSTTVLLGQFNVFQGYFSCQSYKNLLYNNNKCFFKHLNINEFLQQNKQQVNSDCISYNITIQWFINFIFLHPILNIIWNLTTLKNKTKH